MSLAVSEALLHFVWQGAVAGLLLWMALIFMRGRSPAARYALCCAALGLMMLMPVLTAFVLYEPAVRAVARTVWVRPVVGAVVGSVGVLPQPAGWFEWARGRALPLWAVGVVIFSGRMIWFWGQAAWLRRVGTQASDRLVAVAVNLAQRLGVTRRFQVLISTKADGISVIGWLRPAILVPAAALATLTVEQLEAVLAHELAHIRRMDYLVNLLQSTVEALLFYHPAVWWVSRRIRCERELCCDDLAVGVCGDAVGYARALSLLERLRLSAPRIAMATTGGELLYRIRRIVGVDGGVAPSRTPGIAALAAVLAFAAMSLNHAHGQAVQVPSQSAPKPAPAVEPPAVPGPEAPAVAVAPQPGAHERIDAQTRRQISMQTSILERMLEMVRREHEEATDEEKRKEIGNDILKMEISLKNLNRRIAEADAALLPELRARVDEALRQPHTAETEEFLKRLIVEVQSLLNPWGQPAPGTDAKGRFEIRQQEERLIAALRELERESLRHQAQSDSGASEAPEVSGIVFSDLSAAAEAGLRLRLPVRAGDKLSSKALRDSYSVVSMFDPRLELTVFMVGESRAEIRISAPAR